jgi:tetratricopeptide (TPR) repeat protein
VSDIFVSYTGSDRHWAHWIGRELEALGHAPHIHKWEVNGGDDIYAWMERRHDAADHVLCVVSDEYLKAPYSTLERNAALWQAATNRPGLVLLVAVKPCAMPTLSDHIHRCELFGMPEDAARMRLRDFIAERSRPGSAAFPGRVFAVSNVPVHVPVHFMGRDDALAAIESALGRYEGRVAVTALHGLRGVGKTTLAAAYCERHRGDYRATWWVRAHTEPTMRADLAALGVRLGWVSADEKEEPALTKVMERLRHEGEGILLIYDSAPDARRLTSHLPLGGAARVLVTSNAHAWRGVAEPVVIRLWPKAIGAEYLIARTGRAAECAAAEALSEALGGLPLAHEQAAAYCEQLYVGLADYARRFAAAPVRMLDTERYAPAEFHDGLTVTKAFSLAIEQAARQQPAAEPLIAHLALLAPEPVPLFLFREGRAALGEPLAALLDEDGLDEAVAALRAFALVDREVIEDEREPEVTTDMVRLHRLVREVAAMRLPAEAQDGARRALVATLALVYPNDVFNDPRTWPRARRLDALALALVAGNTEIPAGTEASASRLLDRLAAYRQGALGAYAPARPLYERALAIRERALGPEHPHTATSLNDLAVLLKAQGDLAGARPLYERALAICERVLGPEHPDTALSLNNLAFLLRDAGHLAEAEPLFCRAIAIGEKTLGRQHPHVATWLSNLACLLRDSGRPSRGRTAFRRGDCDRHTRARRRASADPALFEPFRSSASRRQTTGRGIGLCRGSAHRTRQGARAEARLDQGFGPHQRPCARRALPRHGGRCAARPLRSPPKWLSDVRSKLKNFRARCRSKKRTTQSTLKTEVVAGGSLRLEYQDRKGG